MFSWKYVIEYFPDIIEKFPVTLELVLVPFVISFMLGFAIAILGSMEVLCSIKEELCGVIYFCFEAGEEVGASYQQILEALRKRRVDTAWAIHVYSALESGKIGICEGPCMAGFAPLELTVKGKGGHGSRPDLSINPVFTAAAIAANIPGAFVNQLNVEKTVTLGLTSIRGGESFNIFPEEAYIRGSMRFFDRDEGLKARDIVIKVAERTYGSDA